MGRIILRYVEYLQQIVMKGFATMAITESQKQIELFQALCEVRYSPSLLYDDARALNNIHKKIKDSYISAPQKNPDGSTAFINLDLKSVLIVGNQSASLTINQPSNYGKFKTEVSKCIPDVINNLEIDNCSRIGVRSQYLMKFENITDASDRLRNASFSNKFINAFPESVLPAMQITVPIDKNLNANLGFRVETHRILEIVNNFTQQDGLVTGIVIDIDLYSESSSLKSDQINGFVKHMDIEFEKILKIALELLK